MENVTPERSLIWRYVGRSAVIGAILGGISGVFLVVLTPKLYEATIELKTTDVVENVASRLESYKVLVSAASKDIPRTGTRKYHTDKYRKMLTVETDSSQQVVRLKVSHESEEQARKVAMDFVKGYEELMLHREKVRSEAQQKRWQILRNQWLAQLEVLEPGRDQARIDELVRKIALVGDRTVEKSPKPSSDIAMIQSPVVLPVVRTLDHLATMGIGALHGILWCVGLCLLCIAAVPSVIRPAKSVENTEMEEELKGSSWLDGEVLRE